MGRPEARILRIGSGLLGRHNLIEKNVYLGDKIMKIVGNNPITYLFLFLYLCFPVTSYPSPSELDLKPKIERI